LYWKTSEKIFLRKSVSCRGALRIAVTEAQRAKKTGQP
jgi:hypothetical protein